MLSGKHIYSERLPQIHWTPLSLHIDDQMQDLSMLDNHTATEIHFQPFYF